MSPTDTAPAIEHRIGETGTVTVRVASWDVEVVAVGGDVARVRNADGAGLPDAVEVERTADSLWIRQPTRFGLDVSSRKTKATKLAIEVPERATLAIQTASGDVQAAKLHGPVQVRTASGDVLLVDVAGEVQAETVSGDVAIRLDAPTTLAVKTVSGDTIVEGSRVERLAYSSTSGDLKLTSELGDGPHAIATVSGDAIVTTRNGIRVAAQTLTGDLLSDLPHSSEGRPGQRSLIVGEGSAVVQFRSVSGDLRVVGPTGHGPTAAIPRPPAPPAPPEAPAPPPLPRPDEPVDPATETARLEILRALERGEIDIDDATRQLADLDGQADA
jgi:microcompartment protein CcmL/EutN